MNGDYRYFLFRNLQKLYDASNDDERIVLNIMPFIGSGQLSICLNDVYNQRVPHQIEGDWISSGPYLELSKSQLIAVSDKLNIKEFNIHYKYSPLIKSKLNITKILLFKSKILSKKIPEEYPGANSLARHYIKKAKYNHLDNILKEQNIERILLKDTHENWINNHYDITNLYQETYFDNFQKKITLLSSFLLLYLLTLWMIRLYLIYPIIQIKYEKLLHKTWQSLNNFYLLLLLFFYS